MTELRSVQIIKQLKADFEKNLEDEGTEIPNTALTPNEAIQACEEGETPLVYRSEMEIIGQLLKDFKIKTKHFQTDTAQKALFRAIDQYWK